MLPYNEKGVLRRLLDSQNPELGGEVLAVFNGCLLRFRHQEELFEFCSGLNRFIPSDNRFRKCKSVYQPARPRKRQQPEQDVSHEDASSKWVEGHDVRNSEWVCESPLAIVIWMNENYRHKYPAPSDVEDVLLYWAVSNFGSAACSALDMDAIDRAFPDRTRSGKRKADIFAV